MGQQIENVRVERERIPGESEGEFLVDESEETPQHPLDSEEAKERLRKLEEWWLQARTAHSMNRREQALDEAFRDHEQWTEEDKAILAERGQAPLVFNMLLPMILWVSGTERKTRVDSRVLPRKEADSDSAEAKTKLLKYLSDVNKDIYSRSDAFMDAATVGVGWIEDGVCDSDGQEMLFSGHESWRNVWWDPLCRDRDLSAKGRYLFRARKVDLDEAIAMFPDRENELKEAAELQDAFNIIDYDELTDVDDNDDYYQFEPGFNEGGLNLTRPVVRLVECWYREAGKGVKVMMGETEEAKAAPYHNVVYNESDKVHQWAVAEKHVTLQEKPRKQVRCAIFIPGTLLQDCQSPYWHNRFPLSPIWCFRRGKDGMPYGLIRGNRPIQEDLNKRRSKALHVLSTNQIIMEQGAVDDIEELRDEADRPDGVIVHKQGKKLELNQDKALAKEHIQLMGEDKEYIQESAGVTSENLGRETNATSGKAIMARQQQGHTVTAPLFDSLRFAIQASGERKLALLEQFYDEQRVVRIVGERGKVEWMPINEAGSPNMITETQADFIVDEEDYNATVRQAMFEQMMDMTSKLPPDVALKLLDLVVEFSDIPGREEIVRRIREINGQKDPLAQQDPEELAAEEQAAAEEQEYQRRVRDAEIMTLEGKAKEAKAKGDKTALEAIKVKLGSMSESLSMAEILAMAPGLGSVADDIMLDAKTGN